MNVMLAAVILAGVVGYWPTVAEMAENQAAGDAALNHVTIVDGVSTETRDPAQVRAFRADHPCPSTGKTTGACPNYVVDHIRPLCFGGADEPANMEWQEREASYLKDQFERDACALQEKCKASPKQRTK